MAARFYDTKIVHAEQHVHLRGALLWRRAFWGYSGTILPNCLEAAAFPGIPAIPSRLQGRPARDGSGRTFGDTAYVYFIFLSYQLTFYHHGLEYHDLP